MQENMPPICSDIRVIPARPVLVNLTTTVIGHAQEKVLFCSLPCAFVATIKPLKCLQLMQLVLINEVLK